MSLDDWSNSSFKRFNDDCRAREMKFSNDNWREQRDRSSRNFSEFNKSMNQQNGETIWSDIVISLVALVVFLVIAGANGGLSWN